MGSQMFSPQENEPQEPEEMQANDDFASSNMSTRRRRGIPRSMVRMSRDTGGYDVHSEGEKLRPAPSISSKQWIWIIIAVVVLLVIGGSVLNTILGSVFSAGLVFVGYVIWRLAFNQAVQLPVSVSR